MAQSIVELFDPSNVEHIKAYNELRKTGIMSIDIFPVDVVRDSMWQVGLAYKITNYHVDQTLIGEVL